MRRSLTWLTPIVPVSLLLSIGSVAADTIDLPATALSRAKQIVVIWRPSEPSPGTLRLDWRDGAGRLVERHRLTLDEALPEAAVMLDLRRARVLSNQLEAWFQPANNGPETYASASFLAQPAPGWPRYEVLYWQNLPAAGLAALPALGVTGTALRPDEMRSPEARRSRAAAGLRWYGENLATDFYAAYHRWTPNRIGTWSFDRAKARYRAGEADAFRRDPPLADPAWLATVQARLKEMARAHAPERPVYLSLGDEPGIGDLAAAWDFDLSPVTLVAWRDWLRKEWATLAALNQDWGKNYVTWDAIMPALTDEALRDEAAVPAWMAFKSGMDALFASALRSGTDAVHRGHAGALAALEGGQIPGWGGYDYARLAGTVDLMEIYDIGNAVAIARSLDPGLRILNTSFGTGPAERHRLWHYWLKGADGLVVWDEDGSVMTPDGTPGPRGLELGQLWRELGGPLGAMRLGMVPERGQVALLYSQASFRMRWLLDRRTDAKAGAPHWMTRDAEAENAESAWHAAGQRAEAALAGLGAQPRWIAPDALVAGTLERDGTRVLVLPHSIALGDAEATAVRRFAAAGGLVLADAPPGERDAQGRLRFAFPLGDLGGKLRYPAVLRAVAAEPDAREVGLRELAGLLDEAGVAVPFRLLDAGGQSAAGFDVRLWRSGDAVLAGIQRVAGAIGEVDVLLQLTAPTWVHLLRGGGRPIFTDQVQLRLGSVDPELILASPAALPDITLKGPEAAEVGAIIPFRLSLAGISSASSHTVQVEVTDPSGRSMLELAEVVQVPADGVDWFLPLTADAVVGTWRVRALSVMGDHVAETMLHVH